MRGGDIAAGSAVRPRACVYNLAALRRIPVLFKHSCFYLACMLNVDIIITRVSTAIIRVCDSVCQYFDLLLYCSMCVYVT